MEDRDHADLAIRWRVSLHTDSIGAYDYLSTARGRERFWAESAPEREGHVHFRFPNGCELKAEVLDCDPGRLYSLRYLGGNEVRFHLEEIPGRGCIVTVEEQCQSTGQYADDAPGWVSVLLALKAAVDFGVDLRNHNPERTWDGGFVDN